MSRRRAYNADTLAIMERFFAALDASIANKLVKNVTRFCNDYGIDKRHLYAQRKDLGLGFSRSDGSCRSFGIAAYRPYGC